MPNPRLVKALTAELPAYGYTPAAGITGRLAAYLELIIAAQPRVRLVGSLDEQTLVRRHLGESLYLGAVLPLGHQHLVDLGSGAGFPGLALAAAYPSLITTLVESNQKKAAFLDAAVSQLGLEASVKVWPHFFERRPRAPDRQPLAGATLVTVRALDKMDALPRWLPRWLDADTQVALWVGEERASAWRAQPSPWHWQSFHLLPGATHRGIQLAIVPRETITSRKPKADS